MPKLPPLVIFSLFGDQAHHCCCESCQPRYVLSLHQQARAEVETDIQENEAQSIREKYRQDHYEEICKQGHERATEEVKTNALAVEWEKELQARKDEMFAKVQAKFTSDI